RRKRLKNFFSAACERVIRQTGAGLRRLIFPPLRGRCWDRRVVVVPRLDGLAEPRVVDVELKQAADQIGSDLLLVAQRLGRQPGFLDLGLVCEMFHGRPPLIGAASRSRTRATVTACQVLPPVAVAILRLVNSSAAARCDRSDSSPSTLRILAA